MNRARRVSRIVATLLVALQIAVPTMVAGQSSLPRPTDRWQVNSSGSYIPGQNVPVVVPNMLPELADGGIRQGDADISIDGNNLVIDQNTARLLAHWSSYNIGEDASVTYNQPDSASIALNIINQESPSQILGQLRCNASCWLVNPNGIIFGKNAQVDVQGLIAAAMEFDGVPMDLAGLSDDERNALRDSFQSDFLFFDQNNPRPLLSGGRDEADFTGQVPRVVIEEGAIINSPNAPALIAGPEVINEGTVTSENGQVVLAGTRDEVYVALTNNATTDDQGDFIGSPNYRGFLVEVNSGNRTDGARGAAVNAGVLTSNFGNVTLVASEIVQAGKIESKTAVDVNGSVRLIGRDMAGDTSLIDMETTGLPENDRGETPSGAIYQSLYIVRSDGTSDSQRLPLTNAGEAARDSDVFVIGREAGHVSLRSGSEINIGLDDGVDVEKLSEGKTGFDALDEERLANNSLEQIRSQVNIEGQTVVMDSGASIVAPNANLTIRTRKLPTAVLVEDSGATPDPEVYFEMRSGATIDLSGTDTEVVSSDRNTVDIFITSSDLKDIPEQKGGELIRETLSIDVIQGTPLLGSESGKERIKQETDQIQRTAVERSIDGGTVDIFSVGNAFFGDDAQIDVSGGKYTVEAGFVETSRVVGSNGIVDISEIDIEDTYTQVLTGYNYTRSDNTWAATDGYRPIAADNRFFRDAYSVGGSAGDINVRTSTADISSSARFLAGVEQGTYQLFQDTLPDAAVGGNIALTFFGQQRTDVFIVDAAQQIADQMEENRRLELDAAFIEDSKAGRFTINNGEFASGLIVQEADLTLATGTDLQFTSNGIYMLGDIRTAGGDVTLNQIGVLNADQRSEFLASQPDFLSQYQLGVLQVEGQIDTSGNWVNQPRDFTNTAIVLESFSAPSDNSSSALAATRQFLNGREQPLNPEDFELALVEFKQSINNNSSSSGQVITEESIGAAQSELNGLLAADENGDPSIDKFIASLKLNYLTQRYNAARSKQSENNFNVSRIDAGNIDLKSDGALVTGDSASFVANAGARLTENNAFEIGSAGDIAFSVEPEAFLRIESLDGVSALDAANGGRLTLEARDVLIGNFADLANSTLTENLIIDDQLFNNVDVGSFHFIAGNGNAIIDESADIDLSHRNLEADLQFLSDESRLDASTQLARVELLEHQTFSGRLILEARDSQGIVGPTDTGIARIDNGALITGSAGSSVDLIANERILIDGQIDIAGGSLSALLVAADSDDRSGQAHNYILLGDNADLDFSASSISVPRELDSLEQKQRLVNAGRVDLNALHGSVLVAEGADINLSGAMVSQSLNTSSNAFATETVITPLKAGDFSVVAERSFDVASIINFGDASEGYGGGTQTYRLSQLNTVIDSDGDPITTNISGGSIQDYDYSGLNIRLGDNRDFLLPQTSDDFNSNVFVSSDYLNIGRIAQDNLNGSNTAVLTLDVDNTDNRLNANDIGYSAIQVLGDTSIAASESIQINTANMMVDGQHSLSIDAPYIGLGETNRINLDSNNEFSLETGDIQREIATLVAGQGQLIINGNNQGHLVDLNGSIGISGVSDIDINANTGVRLRSTYSRSESVINEDRLTTLGDLSIVAPLIYADSLANYEIDLTAADSQFSFTDQQNSNPHQVISAGGKIGIKANQITIDSTVAAPFGEIDLGYSADSGRQTDSVVLGDNSVLTVAGVDNVPLGRIAGGGLSWGFNLDIGNGASVNLLENESLLNGKQVSINSAEVSSSAGAEIDLSGQGNIFSREFISGLGGSIDILAGQHYQNTFAIIPTQQSGIAPFDPVEFSGSSIPWGTTFEISGSNQLPNGEYTVLPANYALIPGAYLVTAQSTQTNIINDGFRTLNTFGAEVVSGRFSHIGTNIDNSWSGFRVEPGTVVDQRAEYRLFNVDNLITERQPGARPSENGLLSLAVSDRLNFEGSIISNNESSIGASLDITNLAGDDIVVGSAASGSALLVDPSLFSTANAGSVLIGGTRTWSTEDNAWLASSSTGSVTFSDADISTQELMVVAQDQIELNNSTIDSTGASVFTGSRWVTDNDSVTLLSSSSTDSQLVLSNLSTPSGNLLIDNNSRVLAQSFGLAYSGNQSLSQVNLASDGDTRLQLVTDTIGIGLNGILSAELLESASQLELKANSTIEFSESVNANLQGASLQANEITLADNIQASLNAENGTISFLLSNDVSSIASASSDSQLTISAERLLFESLSDTDDIPRYLSSNAASVQLSASDALLVKGKSTFETSGELRVNTPLLAAEGTGDLTLASTNDLLINNTHRLADLSNSIYSPGARFNLHSTDGNVAVSGTAISARSGLISISSLLGNVDIADNNHFDVSSYSLVTPNETISHPAGLISIRANNDLSINDPRAFNFGTNEQSGNGGVLELLAGGQLSLSDANYDRSVGQWSSGGVSLNVQADNISGGLADLLFLNGQGFNGDIDILLTGDNQDINVDAADTLNAENLRLATLSGQTLIAGTINVNNASENVVIHGGSGVLIGDTANINVSGSKELSTVLESYGTNGFVRVDSDAVLNLQNSHLEIVKSHNDFSTGNVQLNDNDSISGDVILSFALSRENSTPSQSDIQSYTNEALASINAANAASYVQGATGNLVLRPLVDIYSTGGMTISQSIDLTGDSFYTNNNVPGVLQLRAADGINVNADINSGLVDFNTFLGRFGVGENGVIKHIIEDESWGINLATANRADGRYFYTDKLSANADLNINANIVSGTGDINISVAGDLIKSGFIGSVGQAEYSLNPTPILPFPSYINASLPSWGDNTASDFMLLVPEFSGFSLNGGDVNINVGGDLISEAPIQTPSSFIQTIALDNQTISIADYDQIRAWAPTLNELEGGIVALGGGDIDVNVDGKIENESFLTPSLGIGDVDVTKELQGTRVTDFEAIGNRSAEVINGGDINVFARGDILHSVFANDGANVDVRTMGSISNRPVDDFNTPGVDDRVGSALFIGSNTAFNVLASQGAKVDGVVNTRMISNANNVGSLFGGRTDSLFFDGFEETSFNLQSVSGEVRFAAQEDELNAFVDLDLSDERFIYNVLPSEFKLTNLDGDIVLGEGNPDFVAYTLFPAASSNFSLIASDNVYSDASTLIINMPNASAESLGLLSIADNFDANSNELLIGNIRENLKLGTQSSEFINGTDNFVRTDFSPVQIYALNGNIGGNDPQDKITINIPKQVDLLAGNDIINTSVNIQHNQAGDISSVVAGGDISYSLDLDSTGRINSATITLVESEGISIAGPGDLIVSAGGDINLAATGGIRSVGNSLNSRLDSDGANLHVFSGFDPSNFSSSSQSSISQLIGIDDNDAIQNNAAINALVNLNLSEDELAQLSLSEWFAFYAENAQQQVDSVVNSGGTSRERLEALEGVFNNYLEFLSNISRANGTDYLTNAGVNNEELTALQGLFSGGDVNAIVNDENFGRVINVVSTARSDWQAFDAELQLRVAASAMKNIALENPEFLVSGGDKLFSVLGILDEGFSSVDERRLTFESYWNAIGRLTALEYLLEPNRQGDLLASLGNNDLSAFTGLSVADQLNAAATTFVSVDRKKQLLIASRVMSEHNRQSTREGAEAGNRLINFERGFVAQRMFFGDDYNQALAGMINKSQLINSGQVTDPSSITFGDREKQSLASIEAVFQAWSAGTGVDFSANSDAFDADVSNDINLLFSTIQTQFGGGDVNLFASSGSVDVGLSASQLAQLGLDKGPEKQGILAIGLGDVNSIVANNYNVNESRSFSLSGGSMNLWSVYGDIDAGRGANSVFTTPSTDYQYASVDGADDPARGTVSGSLIRVRPPAVSGSGVGTSPSRNASSAELTNEQRFYRVAEGAGGIALATPLGIVDAGEAGIQSAGDLFIAAAEVRGADNISAGGVEVGVSNDTSVDASVATAGSSAFSAGEAVEDSVTSSATNSNSGATAFITIELLDTGT